MVRRDPILPRQALPFEVVVDRVFAAVEFTGQEVFESAGPHAAYEQAFAYRRSESSIAGPTSSQVGTR